MKRDIKLSKWSQWIKNESPVHVNKDNNLVEDLIRDTVVAPFHCKKYITIHTLRKFNVHNMTVLFSFKPYLWNLDRSIIPPKNYFISVQIHNFLFERNIDLQTQRLKYKQGHLKMAYTAHCWTVPHTPCVPIDASAFLHVRVSVRVSHLWWVFAWEGVQERKIRGKGRSAVEHFSQMCCISVLSYLVRSEKGRLRILTCFIVGSQMYKALDVKHYPPKWRG